MPQTDPLRPTLPIPATEVRKETLTTFFRNPAHSGSLAGSAGLGILLWSFNAAALAAVPVIVTGGVLTALYRKQLPKARKEALIRLVTKSNQEQKEELKRREKILLEKGYQSYATNLSHFNTVKSSIEEEIHKSGEVDERKKRIEQLVDTLLADVVENFDYLVELDSHRKRLHGSVHADSSTRAQEVESSMKNLAGQIERAYLALREIGRNIPDVINPAPERRDEVSNRLEDTIAELSDEAEIAQRVGSRLSNS